MRGMRRIGSNSEHMVFSIRYTSQLHALITYSFDFSDIHYARSGDICDIGYYYSTLVHIIQYKMYIVISGNFIEKIEKSGRSSMEPACNMLRPYHTREVSSGRKAVHFKKNKTLYG